MRKSTLRAFFFLAISQLAIVGILETAAFAGVSVGLRITIAPPPIPVYSQPPMPGPGYIWIPGYWAYSEEWGDYYWVRGKWTLAPRVGVLWTPGYWALESGFYIWHAGYWAATVGYYGGIDYGFGYPGNGYFGGYWRNKAFYYNRFCNNFGGVRVSHFYNQPFRSTPRFDRGSFDRRSWRPAERMQPIPRRWERPWLAERGPYQQPRFQQPRQQMPRRYDNMGPRQIRGADRMGQRPMQHMRPYAPNRGQSHTR